MKSLITPLELSLMGRINNYDGAKWRIKDMVSDVGKPRPRQSGSEYVEYAVDPPGPCSRFRSEESS